MAASSLPLVLFAVLQVGLTVFSDDRSLRTETAIDDIGRNPVLAVTGLMLGLSVMNVMQLAVMLSIAPVTLALALLIPLLLDVRAASTESFFGFTMLFAYAFGANLVLGFVIRMLAEGRWSISRFWAAPPRILRVVSRLFSPAPKGEQRAASASPTEQTVDGDPDQVTEPPEQSESESAPEPSPPRRGPAKKTARKRVKK